MAMQFLEGRELSTVIGRPIPPPQCVDIVTQILRGLEHAHAHGVVHRDLKPDNIFVTRDHEGREVLKIVDFGIAKLLDDRVDGVTTRVGAVVGTPAYMSPEQALGEEIDARADLYSVGIIAYELLTGRPPFVDADPQTLMRAHVDGAIPPLPPRVPILLTAILSKLMAKDRRRRYSTATAALTALRRIESALQADDTPWLALLAQPMRHKRKAGVDPAKNTHTRNLEAVDSALRNILAQRTPVAQNGLESGILHGPAPAWNVEVDEFELQELHERPGHEPTDH
jgi:serine/threonine protein kinase